MARYHDRVGFLIPIDDQRTGLATNRVVERPYYGKVLEHTRRWESSEHVNDDLSISNQISITANDYAFKHMSAIAYARYMGGYWKVTSIRVKGPEIVLTLGGVWNGQVESTAGAIEARAHGLVPEAER